MSGLSGVAMKLVLVIVFCSAAAVALPSPDGSNGTSSSETNATSARMARFDERKFAHKYQDVNSISANPSKNEVTQFLTTKNIIRTLIKLVFGNNEESAATSRQILGVLVKVLDMLKGSFGQKARSSAARGIRDTVDDAAVAGVTMLKGYVQSVLAKDDQCMQRYMCEASQEAVKEGREMGYLFAQFAGYAASYALEKQKSVTFQSNYDASRRGRSGEDCTKLYQTCNEAD